MVVRKEMRERRGLAFIEVKSRGNLDRECYSILLGVCAEDCCHKLF